MVIKRQWDENAFLLCRMGPRCGVPAVGRMNASLTVLLPAPAAGTGTNVDAC